MAVVLVCFIFSLTLNLAYSTNTGVNKQSFLSQSDIQGQRRQSRSLLTTDGLSEIIKSQEEQNVYSTDDQEEGEINLEEVSPASELVSELVDKKNVMDQVNQDILLQNSYKILEEDLLEEDFDDLPQPDIEYNVQQKKLSNVDEPQEEDSNSYIRKNNTDEEGGQDLEEPQEEPQDKTIELNNSEPGQESAQQNVDNDTVIVPATGTMLSQRSLSSAASSSSSSSKNGSSQAMPYIIVVVLVVVLAVGYVVVRRRFSRRTQGFVPLTSITKDD